MFYFKCVCGQDIVAASREGVCVNCHREYVLREADYSPSVQPKPWPALAIPEYKKGQR